MFKLGTDNKAAGLAVLELEIESVGFSDNTHVFEIKLVSGVSHEFKCRNLDEFLQWKRSLSDYRGSGSTAVETVTLAGFARKLLCMFAQEHGAEAVGNVFGGGDEGGELGGEGVAVELVGGFLSDDQEEGAGGDDDGIGGEIDE